MAKTGIGIALLLGIVWAGAASAAEVRRTDYENGQAGSIFVPCERMENTFAVTEGDARSGHRYMSLRINPVPLFAAPLPRVDPAAKPACVHNGGIETLAGDDNAERAELWDEDGTVIFGEEWFYGFSMRVPLDTAPKGDFNRLVIAQWKAQADDSPFLAFRLTGGFFHITLDVDAKADRGRETAATTCKVLLAFESGAISPFDPPLELDRPVSCETQLRGESSVRKISSPLEITRSGYLPSPVGRWTDFIVHIRGGVGGIVEVFANGRIIATATGTIGHAELVPHKRRDQLFKIGPYRDPASYPAVVEVDNLARGTGRMAVDPAIDRGIGQSSR
jgi:polysaccharide lyase-like protein